MQWTLVKDKLPPYGQQVLCKIWTEEYDVLTRTQEDLTELYGSPRGLVDKWYEPNNEYAFEAEEVIAWTYIEGCDATYEMDIS